MNVSHGSYQENMTAKGINHLRKIERKGGLDRMRNDNSREALTRR